jgi:hypothetical protein
VLGACLGLLAFAPRAARAGTGSDDAAFDGAWTITPLTETFVVQQWGRSCGPAPVSRTVFGAGPATVSRDGGELAITATAAHRTLHTDQCIDPMPTLARDAHSSDGRTWRTRCTTPSNDPRHAVVNAAYFLTADGGITIGETGRYEFTIEGSRCVADVTREAIARRAPAPVASVSTAAPPLPAPTAAAAGSAAATPPMAPASDDTRCSSPGDPARLEVRPSRKLLRLGDSYRFRALVVDANGCPTGTPIQWSIAAPRGTVARDLGISPSIDAAGRLAVPAAPLSDSKFDVVASAAGHSARAAVEVTSPEAYEALLAQSGLDSNGEQRDPSITSLATSSLGASGASAEDGARRRRFVFISIVGGLALVLGVVAALAAMRSRKARAVELAAQTRHAERMRVYEREKRDREERHAAQVRAHLESVAHAQQATAEASAVGQPASGPLFCPSCHREFAAGTAFCPFDSNRLVALAGHEAIIAGPVGGICPTCRRGFNPGVRVCPHDGEELVPPAAVPPRALPVRGKICPTCGGRFDGNAAFCGKDGTQLVLLN